MRQMDNVRGFIQHAFRYLHTFFSLKVYIGKHMHRVPEQSVVFFPCHTTWVCCGIAGIVSFKKKKKQTVSLDINAIDNQAQSILNRGYSACQEAKLLYF